MQGFYVKKVLRKLDKFYQKCRLKTGVCVINLSHDNASSHKGGDVTLFLKEQGDYFLEHPPYSPDIAPCDFLLK